VPTDYEYAGVIVGTDGSDGATHAVRVASSLASAMKVRLLVVNAWTDEGSEAYVAATHVTAAAVELAGRAGVTDVEHLEPAAVGTPADALIDVAEDHPDALLVVGGRGLDQALERLGGNVAHQLTHHCPLDLLVTRHDGPDRPARIAITTDGSATATRAVYRGVAVAQALGVTPTLLTVAKDDDEAAEVLSAITEDLASRDVQVETRTVVAGKPQVAKELVEAGAEYDLLVLGNRGMSGPSRLLGSVSNKITHEFPTSLLLVRTEV